MGMVGIAWRTKQYNLEGETALLKGSSGLWGGGLRLEGPAGDEAALGAGRSQPQARHWGPWKGLRAGRC